MHTLLHLQKNGQKLRVKKSGACAHPPSPVPECTPVPECIESVPNLSNLISDAALLFNAPGLLRSEYMQHVTDKESDEEVRISLFMLYNSTLISEVSIIPNLSQISQVYLYSVLFMSSFTFLHLIQPFFQ